MASLSPLKPVSSQYHRVSDEKYLHSELVGKLLIFKKNTQLNSTTLLSMSWFVLSFSSKRSNDFTYWWWYAGDNRKHFVPYINEK